MPKPTKHPCTHCGGPNGTRGGKLCRTCHADPKVKPLYVRPYRTAKPLCVHCHVRAQTGGRRGLCYRCYMDPSIRVLHTRLDPAGGRKPWKLVKSDEQEAAELDALVEAMRPTMPFEHGFGLPPEQPYAIPVIRLHHTHNRQPVYGRRS